MLITMYQTFFSGDDDFLERISHPIHLFDFYVIDDTKIEYKGTFFLWDCKYYTEFFAFFPENMPIVLPKAGKKALSEAL